MAIYTDDRELVLAHQSGDSEAFDALVRKYRPWLVSRATSRLHCRDTAEDAVQEALIRAHRSLTRFNGEYKLGAWLKTILDNVCNNECQRRSRESLKIDRIRASVDFPLKDISDPEVRLGLDTDNVELRTALEQVPTNYRDAVLLRGEGLSYPEIAHITGITEENARARVSRGRRFLKKTLQAMAMLPIVGALLPLLGKLVAGTAVLAVVLIPGGDTPQVQIGPIQTEVVFTDGLEQDGETSLVGDSAVESTESAVAGPELQTNRLATAGNVGTAEVSPSATDTTSSDGTSSRGAAETSTASETGTTDTEETGTGSGETTATTETTPTADLPPLAEGAPLSVAGYNLAVTSELGLSGVVTLQTEAGFLDATINSASRLVVGADPAVTEAEEPATPQAKHHTLSGLVLIDLPDGNRLSVSLSGTATHYGSAMLVVQGADLTVAASFDSRVLLADGMPAQEALPLTGSGSFVGQLKLDTRTGSGVIELQRSS